jgi:hypothetical protein
MAVRFFQILGSSAQSSISQQARYYLAKIPAGSFRLKRLVVA